MVTIQKRKTDGMLWVFVPQEQRRTLNLEPGDKVRVVITREEAV